MHDFPIEEPSPWPLDGAPGEEPGDQEKVGHPERFGERDDIVKPSRVADRDANAQRRVHHHDKNDAPPPGAIDPGDASGCGRTWVARNRPDAGQCLRGHVFGQT